MHPTAKNKKKRGVGGARKTKLTDMEDDLGTLSDYELGETLCTWTLRVLTEGMPWGGVVWSLQG